MKKIAIFDMDRTITRTGTYTPFLIFAALRLAPWRLLLFPAFLLAMPGYPLGLLDRKAIKQWGFRLLIGRRINRERLEGVASSFAERTCAANLFAAAIQAIGDERRAGCLLVMATASPDYYAEPIGKILGFDVVIATRQTCDAQDGVTAQIDGANCYGPEKLDRITRWMVRTGIARDTADVRFYSDHISDSHVLAWADTAVAVNPGRKLRAMAMAKAWAIRTFE
jgi:HAD superfamily hydrolase (TIGR01490 family)